MSSSDPFIRCVASRGLMPDLRNRLPSRVVQQCPWAWASGRPHHRRRRHLWICFCKLPTMTYEPEFTTRAVCMS